MGNLIAAPDLPWRAERTRHAAASAARRAAKAAVKDPQPYRYPIEPPPGDPQEDRPMRDRSSRPRTGRGPDLARKEVCAEMLTVWGRRSSFNVQKVMWLVGELGLAHRHIEAGGRFGGLDTP